jgi:hypothetical protein
MLLANSSTDVFSLFPQTLLPNGSRGAGGFKVPLLQLHIEAICQL